MNHKKDRRAVELVSVIKKYMELYGIKAPSMAQACGFSAPVWYARLKNPSRFTLDELGNIVRRLQIPKEEVLPYVL